MIEYRVGDATAPDVDDGLVFIAHVCNDAGAFGRGFAGAVAERWPHVRDRYRAWWRGAGYESLGPFELGRIQLVRVAPRRELTSESATAEYPQWWVVNMVAQRGLPSHNNRAPLSLHALNTCLDRLAPVVRRTTTTATVVMPRIGTGYGGTPWSKIEPVIDRHLTGLAPVIVYDLPKGNHQPANPTTSP